MTATGRPLRFLGWVIGGWVVLRVVTVAAPMLRPGADAAGPKHVVARAAEKLPTRAAEGSPARAVPKQPSPPAPARAQPAPVRPAPAILAAPALPATLQILGNPAPVAADPIPVPVQAVMAASPRQAPSEAPHPLPSPAPGAYPSRWSLTGWLLWRGDAHASLAQGPLLGGSQGGIRLDYRLWTGGSRSLNLYGRVTRAFERPFAEEAAVGLALRPVEGMPVALMAERRQRLGTGGRNGFAFLLAGGIDPRTIAPRVEIEGYAQAGVVTLPGADAFADGRMAVDYRLTRPGARADLALGLAVSGGAQPGAERLDIGPELRLRLPVAGGHMRLSAEWRQRIGGAARPASGPAVALVADF